MSSITLKVAQKISNAWHNPVCSLATFTGALGARGEQNLAAVVLGVTKDAAALLEPVVGAHAVVETVGSGLLR